MGAVKQKGKAGKYWVKDSNYIGCKCFAPGEYQNRGAIGASGSKSSGVTKTCMTNAYRGCPDEVEFSKEEMNINKTKGWRNA